MTDTGVDEGVEAFAHAQKHINFLLEKSPLYAHLFTKIRLESASSTKVVTSLDLEPVHLNSKGSLHGSVSASIVDFIGGLAIACYDRRMNTGVSTDMHISFAGGAKTGDVLDIEGRTDKCGGTLAFTTVYIRKLEEGKAQGEGALISKGQHTKYVKQK